MQHHVYEPDIQLRMGIRIWREMFRELVESRGLVWRLFVRNLAGRYRQAALGFIWVLVTPFVAIGTFVFLNRAGIVNIGPTDVPYPLFALMGLAVWQIFSTGLSAGGESLVQAGDMITKVSFPREVLVLASMAQSLFEFAVKVVLVAVCFLVFRIAPHWQVVFLPFVVIPVIAFTVALSLVLSLAQGVFRDAVNVVGLLVTFLMFLTPVLYPIGGAGQPWLKLNPMCAMVNAPRDLAVYGRIADPVEFLVATVLSVLLLLLSWRVFHLAETRVPERM